MSYLDIPRIHFGGRFFSDPSTVNNDPTHYNPEVTNPSPWQTPNGQHRFEFYNCYVKSVMGSEGYIENDPIIGSPVTSVTSIGTGVDKNPQVPAVRSGKGPARIVDLDVYQQGVSTIYGLQITINAGNQSITGIVDPPTLNNAWFNAVLPTRSWKDADYDQDSFGGDMNACGVFQSALRINVSDWPETASDVLNKLRLKTLVKNNQYLLSFKFTVDGFRNTPENADYLTGRVVGAIGPVFANEPLYNPGQRWLMPRTFTQQDPWNSPSFNNCCFKVDINRKVLVLDMANSICRQNAGGPPVDLGELRATVVTIEPVAVGLGLVDYSEFAYDNNAHITEIPLNEAQINVLEQGKLVLSMSRTDLGNQAVLTEAEDVDVDFAVEVRPIRMSGDPGTTTTTTVYVSKKGVPLAFMQLAIYLESTHGGMGGVTAGPSDKGNTPQAHGAIQASISESDAYGFATVSITVLKDPGQRTPELDGQLYFLIIYDPKLPHPEWKNIWPDTTYFPPQDKTISCLVFSQYAVNQNPGWELVQSMMAPYMKLYASMRYQLDLTDLHSFTLFSNNPPWSHGYNDPRIGPLGIVAGAIPYYMSFDFNDPRFMPITRDMSDAKILTVMYFVKKLQSQLPTAK
ncbi:MAG: hypothetical protein V4717_19615 [Bacteroidota bacterium]